MVRSSLQSSRIMKIIPILILLVTSGSCFAADTNVSPQYTACMEKSGGVTAEMLSCMSAETRKQDALLNQNYKAAMKATEKPRQPKLVEAQRAWMKFRDADCGFLADPDGGTAATVDAADCVLMQTADRAKSLGGYVKMKSMR